MIVRMKGTSMIAIAARRLAVLAFMATGFQASAVVPLHIQQRAEIRTILELRELANFFPITRLEMTAPNTWRLTAGLCFIEVRFLLTQATRPGLHRRAPHIGPRICQR
jgi:hypothetical protein